MLDWIVCLGAERHVADGYVLCPGGAGESGGLHVNVDDCLNCRHLMAAANDRTPSDACSAE